MDDLGLRRRKVIYDDSLPGGVALGSYSSGTRPVVVSLAEYTSKKTQSPLIRAATTIARGIVRPISVIRQMGADLFRQPSITAAASEAAKPLAITAGPSSTALVATAATAPDKIAKVVDSPILSSVPKDFIISTLSKLKTPALIALGVAALAAAVYGAYRLWKAWKKPKGGAERTIDEILDEYRARGLTSEQLISLRGRLHAASSPEEITEILASVV